MSESALPSKQEALRALLQQGSVWVHLDPRQPLVRCPDRLKSQPSIALRVGYGLQPTITDLAVDAWGVTCTLSFEGAPYPCWLPWHAIYALVGAAARGIVWPEDVPADVVSAIRRPRTTSDVGGLSSASEVPAASSTPRFSNLRAWLWQSPRRKIATVSFATAFCALGVMATATRETCVDSGKLDEFRSPHYWLIDEFDIGHRIEKLVGQRSLLLLRRAGPEGDGVSLPRLSSIRVPTHHDCSWRVVETFADDDQDYRAYGSRFASAGQLSIRRFGWFDGTDSASPALALRMDSELWTTLRSKSDRACTVCFDAGERTACPSVSLREAEHDFEVNSCPTVARNP
jgi:hypothetical protein